mgnify:CR=1 FL=1
MTQDKPKKKTVREVKEAILGERHFTQPQPIRCKWCGSVDIIKHGVKDGEQQYICFKCRRQFSNKDAPYGMRTTVDQLGASLGMYYRGESLSDIAQHLNETYHNPVDRSTVYRWVIKYTLEALKLLEPLWPTVSDTWIADETVLKVEGGNLWFFDIIDEETRFLLASHLSKNRTISDVRIVMTKAYERAGKAPRFFISDSLPAYIDGIERVFGADAKHIKSHGMTESININLIERFHSTIKERTKVLRGFKTLDTAELILDGFLLDYNFFKPHMGLGNKTPAEVAKVKSPCKSWTELVRKVGGIQ